MPKEPVSNAADRPAAPQQSLNVQLMPSGQSDQPVLANFTLVHPAPGVALLDFGFLEPAAMAAISQMAQAGKKVPERLNGRLAARVALSYDALANLHRQLGGVLQAVTKAAREQAAR
jgi:hypothetical protein